MAPGDGHALLHGFSPPRPEHSPWAALVPAVPAAGLPILQSTARGACILGWRLRTPRTVMPTGSHVLICASRLFLQLERNHRHLQKRSLGRGEAASPVSVKGEIQTFSENTQYSIINYSHYPVRYTLRTDLSSNWKFLPFDPPHPFHPPLCFNSLVMLCLSMELISLFYLEFIELLDV